MRMHVVVVFFAVIVVAGCSNRQVYDAALSSQRIQCSKVPEWDYNKCMEEASKSYDQYEREREDAQQM